LTTPTTLAEDRPRGRPPPAEGTLLSLACTRTREAPKRLRGTPPPRDAHDGRTLVRGSGAENSTDSRCRRTSVRSTRAAGPWC